jgi:hypothetical protein
MKLYYVLFPCSHGTGYLAIFNSEAASENVAHGKATIK